MKLYYIIYLFNLFLCDVFIRHKVNKLIKIEVEKKKNIEDKLDSMENELKEIAESKKNKDEILRSLNE